MVDPKVTCNKFISSIVKLFGVISIIELLTSRAVKKAEAAQINRGNNDLEDEACDVGATPQLLEELQPQEHQAYEILQELVNQIGVENNKGTNDPEDEPRPPESAWVISIKEKIQRARQEIEVRSLTEHSIYRIPHNLKDGNDNKAYVPQIVSLGPYHHNKKRLRRMDQHKWRCLYSFLRRRNKKIGDYLDSVKEVEKIARECYEGTISMSSDEFVQMMVLDGCFVIELLLGYLTKFAKFRDPPNDPFEIELLLGYLTEFPKLKDPPNDPVFSMRGLIHTIRQDMIMLENQIPLFILDRLLGVQLGDPNKTGLVAKMAHLFFEPLKPTDGHPVNPDRTNQGKPHRLKVFWESLLRQVTKPVETKRSPQMDGHPVSNQTILEVFWKSLLRQVPEPAEEKGLLQMDGQPVNPIRTILQVFRKCLLHQARESAETKGLLQRRHQVIHCVMELQKAGIKFRKRETDMFWDIQFKDGILQIPPLMIDDGTRSLFLNLIAFEQCHVNRGKAITSYVFFMDNLINSPEDVGHLHDCGIIKHWLGSDTEVAVLFNQLCKGVLFDINDSYLSKLTKEVEIHFSCKWNGYIASLKLKYFSNPWSIISLIAAFFLLALTLTQTLYGVYSYYRPGS